jgi:hypothetical protein
VPVYAATRDDRFTTSANSIFNAKFLDQTSDCGDCVMVDGEASITVKINPSQYGKEGAKLNLSRIQTFAKQPCGFEDPNNGKAKAFNATLNGCATINTIKDFPTVNAPDDIPKYPFDLKEASSFFGHVLVGENATKMKDFYKYLEEGFWEDAKDFALDFIPLLGSVDDFVEAAVKCGQMAECDATALVMSGVSAIVQSTPAGGVLAKSLGKAFRGVYKVGTLIKNSPEGKAIRDGFEAITKQLTGLTPAEIERKYGRALGDTLEALRKFGGNPYVKQAGKIVGKIILRRVVTEAWGEFNSLFKACSTGVTSNRVVLQIENNSACKSTRHGMLIESTPLGRERQQVAIRLYDRLQIEVDIMTDENLLKLPFFQVENDRQSIWSAYQKFKEEVNKTPRNAFAIQQTRNVLKSRLSRVITVAYSVDESSSLHMFGLNGSSPLNDLLETILAEEYGPNFLFYHKQAGRSVFGKHPERLLYDGFEGLPGVSSFSSPERRVIGISNQDGPCKYLGWGEQPNCHIYFSDKDVEIAW